MPSVRIGTFVESRVQWLAGMLSAEPLVSVGWDGRPVYRLAESVTESKDGTFLTVMLRPDARFHNGERVTAKVVAELLTKKLGDPDQLSDISAIEAASERELTIKLNRPNSFKAVDLFDYAVEDDSRPQLRTGPFRVASLAPRVELESFKEYYQGTPSVDRVEIKFFSTQRGALTAMMRGEVNFLHEVSRESISFIEDGGDIRAYPLLRPFTVPLVFNQKHPILGRREVRIALNEAIDRAEVVANGMRGYGQPADGPFWPHHWAYPGGVHAQAYNPKAAALRLDAAALPLVARGDAAMPSRFAFTCLVVAGRDTRFERIALVVQRQLFAVGIDMQLRLVSSLGEFRQLITRGDWDAFIFEVASGRTLRFPYRFWHSKEAVLPTGYSAADGALDRMLLARTDDDVRLAVADVLRVFRQDPPAVFLAFPREARAAHVSFEIPYEPDRDIFGTFRQLTLAPQRARRAP